MVPERTKEQRSQALDAALAARRGRAELRACLKSRATTGTAVLESADTNPGYASLKVKWLLESLPGIGPIRAERILTDLSIAPSRRIQGLGERQVNALLQELAGR